MTNVLVNKTKRGNGPAEKKEGKSMENSKLQTLEKIRPELNLEKWSIWQPAKSKNPPKERILKREITLPDGNKVIAKVEIGFTNKGVLTTEDQKTYYGFIKLWEDAGKPTGPVFCSTRKLAKILKKKWGTNVIEFFEKSSFKLRFNPFIWKNSYYDSETGETIKILDTFTILSELKLIKKEIDGHITKEAGYFRFNDFTLKNLLNNKNKPLFFEIATNFKSEIAQLIYGRIDLIMYDKTCYERRTKELFEDLGLEGEAYKNKSKRKQMLEPALKELLGVFLSTGILIEAQLEKTKDEKDYKVVFKKQPFPKDGVGETKEEKQLLIALPKRDPQVEELVKYFHEKLGRLNHESLSKELDQATALFAECGLEKAKHIISFAVREAQTTNFQMRTFGAIFQYKNEALRVYEKINREQEALTQRQEKEEQDKKEKTELKRREKEELDNLYQSLIPDHKQQLDLLIEQSFKKFNFIPRIDDPASKFYQAARQTAFYETLRKFKQDPKIILDSAQKV